MMRALVTGAGGFVGKRLVPLLEARGDEVFAHDLDVDISDAAAIDARIAHQRYADLMSRTILRCSKETDVECRRGATCVPTALVRADVAHTRAGRDRHIVQREIVGATTGKRE